MMTSKTQRPLPLPLPSEQPVEPQVLALASKILKNPPSMAVASVKSELPKSLPMIIIHDTYALSKQNC